MDTMKHLSLTEDGWDVTLFGAEPDNGRTPIGAEDSADAWDIVNTLDRLERTLDMAFFDFERFKTTVEAAQSGGDGWPLSPAFLSYVRDQSTHLATELENLRTQLREEQDRITGKPNFVG